MWDEVDPAHKVNKKPDLSRGCVKKKQVGATCVGLVAAKPIVMRTCVHNAAVAACKRHLTERTEPEAPRLAALRETAKSFHAQVGQRYNAYRQEWTYDKWLARWPESKQNAIKESLKDAVNETDSEIRQQSLRHSNFNHHKARKGAIFSRASMLTSMVKREVLVGCEAKISADGVGTLADKEPSKARLIHFYRYLDTQESFARHHLAMQKAICSVFNGEEDLLPGIRLTVASAMNSLDKGKWMTDVENWALGDLTWFERDGKRWDSTMGEGHFQLQMDLLDAIAEPEFARHVRQTAYCKCNFMTRGGGVAGRDNIDRFQYEISYTTKSGHNDTSWRNSWINAIITLYSLHLQGLEARAIVIGDDMLVGIKGDFDKQKLIDTETECGIQPEAGRIYDTSLVEFASDVFMPARFGGERRYVAVPKLGKLLAKLFWTHTNITDKEVADFRFSVAYGMRNTLSRAPLYGAFLLANMEGGGKLRQINRWFKDTEEIVDYDRADVNAWLWARYNITPEQVDELETFFYEHAGKVGVLYHPLVDHIIAIDTSDPGPREVLSSGRL